MSENKLFEKIADNLRNKKTNVVNPKLREQLKQNAKRIKENSQEIVKWAIRNGYKDVL